jgi:AraC family transcriptional regulator
MPRTSADQVGRINRTITHIDEHLAAPLDLGALAAVARFSKFHFHKLFKAVTGASPHAYVKRRRLELAHHFLANDPLLSVADAAHLLGFSSPSNFARDFKALYGRSPRELKGPVQDPFGPGAPALRFVDPAQVRLELVSPFRVLYARSQGSPTDAAGVEAVHESLRRECARQGWVLPGAREVVIGKSIPGLTPPGRSLFDYGLELPPWAPVSDPAVVQSIGGGMHARYPYHGDPSTVVECWSELYSTWLRRSGLSVGPGFAFTVTGPPGPAQAGPPAFQLYLPLRSRSHG